MRLIDVANGSSDPPVGVFNVHDFLQWAAEPGQVPEQTFVLRRSDFVLGDLMPGSMELLERCHGYCDSTSFWLLGG